MICELHFSIVKVVQQNICYERTPHWPLLNYSNMPNLLLIPSFHAGKVHCPLPSLKS